MRPKVTMTTMGISEETGLEAWSYEMTYWPPLWHWPWYYYQIAMVKFWRLMHRLGALFVRP